MYNSVRETIQYSTKSINYTFVLYYYPGKEEVPYPESSDWSRDHNWQRTEDHWSTRWKMHTGSIQALNEKFIRVIFCKQNIVRSAVVTRAYYPIWARNMVEIPCRWGCTTSSQHIVFFLIFFFLILYRTLKACAHVNMAIYYAIQMINWDNAWTSNKSFYQSWNICFLCVPKTV